MKKGIGIYYRFGIYYLNDTFLFNTDIIQLH